MASLLIAQNRISPEFLAAESPEGRTPLIEAAIGGNADIVEELICAGAPVDQVSNRLGRTALATASALGHVEVVKILLQLGADPDVVNFPLDESISAHSTAFTQAIWGGHDDIAELLISFGADVDPKSPCSPGVDMDRARASRQWMEGGGYMLNVGFVNHKDFLDL